MKTLLTTAVLLTLGASAMAETHIPNRDMQVPGYSGTFGESANRTAEPVLLIRDFLPWGGDIVPFFTNAGTVVTVISSDQIFNYDLSDYCLVAITAGTTGYYGEPYQANVNAALPLFNSYVLGGGIMLYITGTWGGSIQMPGGAYTALNYDSENTFPGPHYMATGMPNPFQGNYASHDDLLGLPGNASIITTGSYNQVTAAEWTLGSGAVVAMTHPTECYIPGGYCYPSYSHFNQLETNAVEYARNLGTCGDPLPVDALLTPTLAVNCLGDLHCLNVLVQDENGGPFVGLGVTFDVVAGPNTGLSSGTLFTDGTGSASFCYTSYTVGQDIIVVNYTDPTGAPAQSNYARKIWEECNVGANETPAAFALSQNVPNPFNPTTSISFTLAEAGAASLKVFDLAGREMATLVSGVLERGAHSVEFDGANLASGVYVYTLQAGATVESRKMVLMK